METIFIMEIKKIKLNQRQLCDLTLILNGGFSPLEGFLSEDDYNSVVSDMRLKNGQIWPIPVVLDVSLEDEYKTGEKVILTDEEGNDIAEISIDSIFIPNKEKEAEMVYGTKDKDHFGVKYLFENTGTKYIGGKVSKIGEIKNHIMALAPEKLKNFFKEKGEDKIIGFQTRNPMHRAHFEIVKNAAENEGIKVLIHPVIGMTKTGDIDAKTRIESYKAIHENHAKDFTYLSFLSLAMRMAGPKEAVWHAIIRKNHGCTHFIVGRDHAGPGKDKNGIPFYEEYEAQDLAKKYQDEIGIKIVAPKEMVYVKEEKKYLPSDELKEHHTIENISGTKFREMLRNNEDIPEWFSFPEVIEILKENNE